MPLPSIKECPHCGREYYPKSNTQSTCGSRDCRVEHTRRNALVRSFEEKKKIVDNARRESMKDKKQMDTFRIMTFDRMERSV